MIMTMEKAYFIRLGEKIEALREQKEWTQEHLAHISGISAVTISRIESGLQKKVSVDTIRKLANGLGVPISIIVDDALSMEAAKALDAIEKYFRKDK